MAGTREGLHSMPVAAGWGWFGVLENRYFECSPLATRCQDLRWIVCLLQKKCASVSFFGKMSLAGVCRVFLSCVWLGCGWCLCGSLCVCVVLVGLDVVFVCGFQQVFSTENS